MRSPSKWIGDSEYQIKREKALLTKLMKDASHIGVEFIRSGWTSNWSPHLKDFERLLPQNDAVVIMQEIRTTLGRRVRQKCKDKPWRAIWGKGGTDLSFRTIVAAARLAQRVD